MPNVIPSEKPKFSQPPVVEVAANVGFHPIDTTKFILSIPLLQKKLGSKYPKVQIKNEMPEMTGIHFQQIDNQAPFTSPRFWFESEDTTDLVQISNRKLSFNWRKLKQNDERRYKTYEHVWDGFATSLKALDELVSSEMSGKALSVVSMELAYFNHIKFDDFGGSLAKIEQLIPSHSWLKNAPWFGEPNAFNFTWNIPDADASRNVLIQCFTAVDIGTGDPVLRLEIVVQGYIISEDMKIGDARFKKWYEEAHLIIVNTFAAMTAKKVQKEVWGKSNG